MSVRRSDVFNDIFTFTSTRTHLRMQGCGCKDLAKRLPFFLPALPACKRTAGDARVLIVLDAGIQDGIRNLIADFV